MLNNGDDMKEMKSTTGSGGGKGGKGRAAQEAENTLRSAATVRVVEVVSEGEIAGIAGGARGIYINDTPLQNADGTYNFDRVQWDYRVGLPSQSYMQGFPAVEAETLVSTPISASIPVSRTTSQATVDAVRITIQLPQGLYSQSTSTGDITGTSVQFRVEKKLTADGSWIVDNTYTIEGKTNTSYEKQYRIERPAGSGTWDIRVTRLTSDSTTSSLKNATSWSRLTEIQDNKLSYNDIGYVGIAIDAESAGGTIPRRSYLVKGIKCKIPSNYDPVTRVYSGQWNGTFTTAWTDNPAWVLYDLITNSRYGMGAYISEAMVDKFSFYNAAVYNDELVPDGFGGTEPRFTFSAVINARDEALRILTMVAGAFRAQILWVNGLVTITQDRPASPVKLITKSNVIDGKFNYRSTGLFERHTAFNVTFNDRADRHLQRVATVTDSTGIARYGFTELDISAYGATTEGQAIRHGRWALETELNQTELVQFKMSMNGFDLLPSDIIKLYDEDYAVTVGSGRIVSVSGTTVTLDREVTLTAGSTIDVTLADGKTIETKNIVESTGTVSTFTISSGFSSAVLENAVYIVKTAVSARQFRIMGLRQEDNNEVVVEALYHDPAKYARVETGFTVPTSTFSSATTGLPRAPTGITFENESIRNIGDGTVYRRLRVQWDPDNTGGITGYRLYWSRDSNNSQEIKTYTNSAIIPVDTAGIYKVLVFARNALGQESVGTPASYNVVFYGSTGGYEIENLQLKTGGTIWQGDDFTVVWTPKATNPGPVHDYKVDVLSSTDQLLRTEYVDHDYIYTLHKNIQDGGPRGVIKIRVTPRDTYLNEGIASIATFTNPPPSMVNGISVVPGAGSAKIWWTANTEPDVAGYLVWRGTTSGFAPSASNVIFDGNAALVSDDGITAGTTYYYKVAAYDKFNKNLTGVTLVISSEYSLIPLSAGVPTFASAPPNNSVGDVYYNSTEGKLYRWYNTAWTAAVPAVDITGTIESTQITDGAISTPKLAAGAVTADQIASNAVTSDKIIANAITGGKILAGEISTSHMTANTINGDRIAAGTLAASKITTTNLSAISATIGLLRTATSGARMEIADNVIRVYDASGVLRIKLGNLA